MRSVKSAFVKAVTSIIAVLAAVMLATGAPITAAAAGEQLHGIDVSSWQAGLDCGSVQADFVIVKVSEGTGYTYGGFRQCADAALRNGKKLGLYHFTYNTSSPQAEASFFWRYAAPYRGRAMMILDNETNDSPAWALNWLNAVQHMSGVKPVLYESAGMLGPQWSSVAAADYGLWIAGYWHGYTPMWGYQPYPLPYSTSPWSNAVMFQYSSSGHLPGWGGNLDFNVFYGGRSAWDAYAGASGGTGWTPAPAVPAQAPTPSPSGSVCEVVRPGDTLSAIAAREGGSWSDWSGYRSGNPNLVFAGERVCRSGATQASSVQTSRYVVRYGDTLSGIAASHGTTAQAIASANGISNPNWIFAGSTLVIPGGYVSSVSSGYGASYRVRPGDTLSAIAARSGTSWQTLQRINNISNPNVIFAGSVIRMR